MFLLREEAGDSGGCKSGLRGTLPSNIRSNSELLPLSETFSEDERAKYGPIPLGPEAEKAAAEKAALEAKL